MVSTFQQVRESSVTQSTIFSDSELIQQALAGSQYAFEQMVHRYETPLFRFISTFLYDYDQVCDILQQVLIQLYISLPTLNPGRPLRPWLFQVARNRSIDELRRVSLLHFSELEGDNEEDYFQAHYAIVDPTPLPEELVEQQELREYLCQAIRALPLHYRRIVALRYISQLSFGEIGETLGIPETTARAYFRRAKPLMRASLEEM
ncbi:MAG: RNA polymerase sigma factor [Ktedonobacteraceae bacterium]